MRWRRKVREEAVGFVNELARQCLLAARADSRLLSWLAARVLAPLLGQPAINAAWSRLKQRVSADPILLDVVFCELCAAEWQQHQDLGAPCSNQAVQTDELGREEPHRDGWLAGWLDG